ncbi:DUF4157 domain-containing protein [Trichocoleus sp. Lan]|uniref:eCIS core domain-containing protein n=1 Tax=Trichocoleus sp. Lan TaxID=2933927 RepID=UPI003296E563
MKMRLHDPKKEPKNSSAQVKSQFQSRPFAVQAKPQDQETPDLQAQLESAQRFGHDFANISIQNPGSPTPSRIQPKLTIGAPGDKYEQEADKTAAEVVQRLHAPVPSYGRDFSQPESEFVQRMKAGTVQNSNLTHQQEIPNRENRLMRKLDVSVLQREVMPEEDKELQMKPMVQRKSDGDSMDATPDLEATIQQARGSGQPLAQSIRQPMEQAFGADFSEVKIHTDAQSDQLNQSIQAKAFTTGQDVFFRQGAYEPGSREGQELIAHELTHVVQQNGGTVRRSIGKRATAESDCGLLKPNVSPAQYASTIQRYVQVNTVNSVVVNAMPGLPGIVPAEFEAQQPLGVGQVGQVLVVGAPLQLRVSEDGRMAIEDSDLSARQPKVFYAEQAVWQASNPLLAQSKYELYADRANAITVTIPGQGPHNLDRVLARVVNPVGAVHTPSEQGIGLDVDQDCIMVATAIIGQPPRGMNREMVIAYGGDTSRDYGEYRTAAAMLEWAAASSWLSKAWPTAWWELWMEGSDDRATRMALEKFQKTLSGGSGMQDLARQYALLQRDQPALAAQIAQALGVNVHAQPGVGEAYESAQLGLPTNFVHGPGPDWEADPTGATISALTTPPMVPGGATGRTGWGQHIGAVVAMSAGNRVTLENYARSHELGSMRGGPDYYFQMYGPPTLPNQTWHHAWTAGAVAAGLAPVKNAVTIVVRQ